MAPARPGHTARLLPFKTPVKKRVVTVKYDSLEVATVTVAPRVLAELQCGGYTAPHCSREERREHRYPDTEGVLQGCSHCTYMEKDTDMKGEERRKQKRR